ncbi:hypothetical protein ACFWY9_21135 [Amycolatopsis sp. NPDC059027]|uniref:hypothetical protein n=1 Tax=unclassified Amycolatopsis TaxID=2618356 RepID=UPI00366F2954
MSETDLLDQLFQAWRDDIESVPFPQFTELLIPPQQTRAEMDARRGPRFRERRVTNATRGPAA